MTDLELYFEFRCWKGLKKRGLDHLSEYRKRLEYEIQSIRQMGYSSYFCIVADFIIWAIAHQIPVGPGRGSCAGSLASYCMEITHLDPIRYGLIFERFINPERVSMPDIDCDFCELRRHEVIKYVKEKYGADRVAHIGTYGRMKSKAAIRDAGRTLGYDYQLCDKLAKMTLEPIEGKNQPLAVCYEKVPELKNSREGLNGPKVQEILYWAEKIEDRTRAFGTHAAGIVISHQSITEVIPLYPGKDGAPTTQFEMKTVEECGLIKFDFLGLRALTTIDRCVKIVSKNYDITINPLQIPVDDEDTYKMLQSGDVLGVFQLEGSQGLRDIVIQIKPTCLEDLSAIIALYRPGPLSTHGFQNYLKVRMGEESPQYICPELKPILEETDGMLLYQEQILEIAKQLAGYTLGESDLLRRAVGKKSQAEMDAQEAKFKKGLQELSNISKQDADLIWNDIKGSASYSFNKSHAISYAYIGYQMAYLKCHYPIEFLCACLVSDSDETDKVIQYISYAQEKGIAVRGPSINKSEYDFSIDSDNAIRFGIGTIKNLGKPVEDIIQERKKHGDFTDILNFASRVNLSKINRRKLESLVLSGAFDETNQQQYTRASLLTAIDDILRHKEEEKRYEKKLETFITRKDKYDIRCKEIAKWEQLTPAERKEKNIKKPGRMKAPEKPEEPLLPQIPNLPEMAPQQLLAHEKELLGFYISGHPLDNIKEKSRVSIANIKANGAHKQRVKFIAIPSIVEEFTTKKRKQKMANLVLEDKTGTIQASIFSKPWSQHKQIINIFTPAQYIAEIEITEVDDVKNVKLLISGVENLRSVDEYQNRTLEITIPVTKCRRAAQIIKEYQGGNLTVHLQTQTQSGCIIDLGIFKCQTSRDALERKFREL